MPAQKTASEEAPQPDAEPSGGAGGRTLRSGRAVTATPAAAKKGKGKSKAGEQEDQSTPPDQQGTGTEQPAEPAAAATAEEANQGPQHEEQPSNQDEGPHQDENQQQGTGNHAATANGAVKGSKAAAKTGVQSSKKQPKRASGAASTGDKGQAAPLHEQLQAAAVSVPQEPAAADSAQAAAANPALCPPGADAADAAAAQPSVADPASVESADGAGGPSTVNGTTGQMPAQAEEQPDAAKESQQPAAAEADAPAPAARPTRASRGSSQAPASKLPKPPAEAPASSSPTAGRSTRSRVPAKPTQAAVKTEPAETTGAPGPSTSKTPAGTKASAAKDSKASTAKKPEKKPAAAAKTPPVKEQAKPKAGSKGVKRGSDVLDEAPVGDAPAAQAAAATADAVADTPSKAAATQPQTTPPQRQSARRLLQAANRAAAEAAAAAAEQAEAETEPEAGGSKGAAGSKAKAAEPARKKAKTVAGSAAGASGAPGKGAAAGKPASKAPAPAKTAAPGAKPATGAAVGSAVLNSSRKRKAPDADGTPAEPTAPEAKAAVSKPPPKPKKRIPVPMVLAQAPAKTKAAVLGTKGSRYINPAWRLVLAAVLPDVKAAKSPSSSPPPAKKPRTVSKAAGGKLKTTTNVPPPPQPPPPVAQGVGSQLLQSQPAKKVSRIIASGSRVMGAGKGSKAAVIAPPPPPLPGSIAPPPPQPPAAAAGPAARKRARILAAPPPPPMPPPAGSRSGARAAPQPHTQGGVFAPPPPAPTMGVRAVAPVVVAPPPPLIVESDVSHPAATTTQMKSPKARQTLSPRPKQEPAASPADVPAVLQQQPSSSLAQQQASGSAQAGAAEEPAGGAVSSGQQEPVVDASSDPRLAIAERVRQALDYQIGASFNSKQLLNTGVFDGMAVEYRRREGSVKVAANTGTIFGSMVRCNCPQCQGYEHVPLAVFELHAGSLHKKPADYTYFSDLNMNLKEMILLVMGEPLSGLGIHLPWPGAGGIRGGSNAGAATTTPAATTPAPPGARSVRASSAVASALIAASAGRTTSTPADADDDLGRPRPARRGPIVPPPGISTVGLNLPVHLQPKVQFKGSGPTVPDTIPETFTLEYWRKKAAAGEFVADTTANGAVHPGAAATEETPAIPRTEETASEPAAAVAVAPGAAAGAGDVKPPAPEAADGQPACPPAAEGPADVGEAAASEQQQGGGMSSSSTLTGREPTPAPQPVGTLPPAPPTHAAIGDNGTATTTSAAQEAAEVHEPAATASTQPTASPAPATSQPEPSATATPAPEAAAPATTTTATTDAAAMDVDASHTPPPATSNAASTPASEQPTSAAPAAGSIVLSTKLASPVLAQRASLTMQMQVAPTDVLSLPPPLDLGVGLGAAPLNLAGPSFAQYEQPLAPMVNVDGIMMPLPAHVHPPPPGMMVKAHTQRNKNKHQRLFEPGEGSLRHGQHVTYKLHGQNLLHGTIQMDPKGQTGILCHHCNTIISPSTFEAHAGHRQRRNPYDAITTEEGLTLREMAARLPPLPDEVTYTYVPEDLAGGKAGGKNSLRDRMISNVLMRRMPGMMPGGGRGRGRGNTSFIGFGGRGRGRASGSGRQADTPGAPADLPQEAGGAGDAGANEEPQGPQLSALTSSCVICFDASFDREGCSERTVLICDQCEREFHVGCLRKAGHKHLDRIPDGHWYCSAECHMCHAALQEQVAAGEMVVSEDGHTLRVMKGRDGTIATGKQLHTVLETLQESFDPIVSSSDGMDLLPSMVLATEHGDFDFQGVYSLLLRHRGKPVCAGLIRVFGSSLAELPLVATRLSARRQGHARVFMRVLEERLALLGVRILALPAAHDAVITWVNGFKFRYMDPTQLQCALAELRLLIFPGTMVLYKNVGAHPGGFRGVEGAQSSLLAAHPDGFPEEIQSVIDMQAGMMADDCVQHGLPLEPWMPLPSATAMAAVEQRRQDKEREAAAAGGGSGSGAASATPYVHKSTAAADPAYRTPVNPMGVARFGTPPVQQPGSGAAGGNDVLNQLTQSVPNSQLMQALQLMQAVQLCQQLQSVSAPPVQSPEALLQKTLLSAAVQQQQQQGIPQGAQLPGLQQLAGGPLVAGSNSALLAAAAANMPPSALGPLLAELQQQQQREQQQQQAQVAAMQLLRSMSGAGGAAAAGLRQSSPSPALANGPSPLHEAAVFAALKAPTGMPPPHFPSQSPPSANGASATPPPAAVALTGNVAMATMQLPGVPSRSPSVPPQ